MYLISVETVKIKDFIFNTNKLKTIRGASFLLDFLNQIVVRDILIKNNIKDEDILYIAAGNGKFYCENEENAEKIIREIKENYRVLAPDSKLAISKISVVGKKIWDALDESARATNIVKNKGFSKGNIDLPFVEKCGICCENPVEIKKGNFDQTYENYISIVEKYLFLNTKDKEKIKNQIFQEYKGICPSCFAKYIFSNLIKEDSKKIGFYSRVNEEFKNEFEPAETLEDYNLKKSFIGFMYSDGDSVGEYLKNSKINFQGDLVNGEKNYKKFLKEFSLQLDETTKGSLIEVLREMKDEGKLDKHLGEFLIVGGDDVCGIFPGHLVLEISNRFQERFNEKMKKYCKGMDNITSSSGVIIGKVKTPLHYLFDQSLILQKNAKKKRYFDYKDKKNIIKNGYIDFEVIGSEGTVDIMKFREKMKNLMDRPYSIEKTEKNINFQDLLKIIENLKEINFPKNKLRRYYDLKVEIEINPEKSLENIFELMNTILKLDKAQREFILKWIGNENIINFNENTLKNILSNIFDVLEIYDFI